MRHSTTGRLDYSVKDGFHRLVVDVDPQLHKFLRALIPKHYVCRPQKYAPHITVVRGETPTTGEWGKGHGELVSFSYETYLFTDEVYWWYNCFSDELTELRLGLGLPESCERTRPPDGSLSFHSTIGNAKVL